MRFLIFFFPFFIFANPSGSQVVAGNASIHEEGNHILITADDRTIIEWQKFSIGEKEITQFLQPSATAAVLNKVVGDMPSSIMGKMVANGHVLLINPQGILMGLNSTIDTGALTLSTLPLVDDQSFLNDESLHFCQNGQSYLHSQGTIVAQTGDIVFIAPSVTLEGSATAPQGTLRMGVGCDVIFNPEGEERIFIQPSKFSSFFGMDIRGQIAALNAELKADGNAYALAICIGDRGKISASEIVSKEGKIWLVAEGGDVWLKGEIAAPAGEVQILGKNITVADTAAIDVSSDEKGGSLYIGGGYRGEGLYASQRTIVSQGATLASSALEKGDGGKVIVWSNGLTSFLGKINAEGGKLGGNGGFVEVSGLETLDFHGLASTLAPFGQAGTLLLDPSQITITTMTANVALGNCGFPANTYASTVAAGTLAAGALVTQLGMANTIITTANGTCGSLAGTGDIIITSDVSWNTAFSLTLLADNDVSAQATVSNAGVGNIVVTAARDVNVGSTISTVNTGFSTGGALTMTSTTGSIALLGGSGATSAAAVGSTGTCTISAPLGNIVITGGTGDSSTASLVTPGTLTLSAGGSLSVTAGSGMSSDASISMSGAGTHTVSVTGDINLIGGSVLANGTFLQKNGAGTLNLTAGGALILQGVSGGSLIQGSATGGTLNLNMGSFQMIGGTTAPGDTVINPQASILNINCTGDMLMQATSLGESTITSITAPVPITLTVGGSCTMTSASILSLSGVTATIGGNFTVQTANASIANTGIITVLAAADISITAGNDISISGLSLARLGIVSSVSGSLLMIAGRNLTLGDFSGVSTSALNSLTLVCDNDFPTAPGIGPGAFSIASTASLANGNAIQIFTARRDLNSIDGTINGATFTPGPLLVDSNQERWFVYYPNSYTFDPFVFFYKGGDLAAAAASAIPLVDFANFMELFRDLHPFSEYIDLAIEFSVFNGGPNDYFIRTRTFENIDVTSQVSPNEDPAYDRRPKFR